MAVTGMAMVIGTVITGTAIGVARAGAGAVGWGWGWGGPRYGRCWEPGYGRVPCGWWW